MYTFTIRKTTNGAAPRFKSPLTRLVRCLALKSRMRCQRAFNLSCVMVVTLLFGGLKHRNSRLATGLPRPAGGANSAFQCCPKTPSWISDVRAFDGRKGCGNG